MLKKVISLKLMFFYAVAFSQVLTYVGSTALVTIQSQTLLYNGGGLQTAGTAVINNSGNVMVNGASSDLLNLASTANFNLKLASTSDYGQLYVTGITQGNITGKVNKEYVSDFVNGATGRQQVGLPFYNYKIQDLVSVFGDGNLNVTNIANNSSGRFNVSSAFWWNNARARFDQIAYNGTAYDGAGNPSASFISPMTYYILPRRKSDGSYFWAPTTDKKIFTGIPASDMLATNVEYPLSGAYSGSFGVNGSNTNYFTEKYSSYIDDPFRSKTPNWATDYGLNLYQLANPYLTNLDLRYIGTSEAGNQSDDNAISNLEGVAYYGNSNVNWNALDGSNYPGSVVVLKVSDGYFQAGDVRSVIIKPLGAFMVKLSSNAGSTLKLNKTRRFKYTSRQDGTDYAVSANKSGSGEAFGIPADKIVKQVAAVMYDKDGFELDRTYFAVSPSAATGFNSSAKLQAYSGDRKIFTKEEKPEGGLDYNYNEKLYINEANEIGFKSKEIPLYINYTEQPYQLKFEVYEKGERVPDGLSNGNSFYLKNEQGQYTKIVDGGSIAMNGSQNLGLYYEMPEGTLATSNTNVSQTIIAKKDSQWVVRFSKNWKTATVEVYSAAGQLLNTKSQISTQNNYIIPLNYQAKNMFVVKATSDNGEVVIKKIVN